MNGSFPINAMSESVKKFGWKRKIGACVSKAASSTFENEAKDDESITSNDVDWLTSVKKRNIVCLEDGMSKASRLTQEGTLLASSERYWEALKKWDEALLYCPVDEKIHEMKAQALMELCEVFPAVQAAKKAVEYSPTWWVGHQTLGRAYLGLGEVRMAVQSFSRAVHLNPENRELWEEDLLWAFSLLQKGQKLEEEKRKALEEKKNNGLKITEVDSDKEEELIDDNDKMIDIYKHVRRHDKTESSDCDIGRMPRNYVQMRDTAST